VSLEAQRDAKVRILRHLLEPLGSTAAVEPLRGTGNGYHYRNRLLLPVRAGRNGLRAGFFRADTHDLVDVRTCLVQSPPLWDAAATALGLAMQAGVSGYNERLDKGCLRHLLVRATAAGEVGVVFVTATPEFPAGESLARELMRRHPRLAGVAQNVNPGRTNVVLGSETRVLGGRGWLRERVGGLELRASLPAFFQANHEVTGIMAGLVGEWTRDVTGGLLDLYAGVGVLGLTAAAGGRAPWLAGIEESAAAVEDARANAAAVPAVPSEWHAGAVEALLPGLAACLGPPGAVIVDPPRKGLTPEALAAVIALRAPLFIYVSCDPATFARDLKSLLAAGYRLETAVPLDMFPQTWHIELAARLTMNQ
jgi:23S rRNA (uracil-5-)-methyltransferase RumA